MRALYSQSPELWTRRKLALRFDCSESFVQMITKASEEAKQAHHDKLAHVKESWGAIRRRSREDRKTRKEMAKSDVYDSKTPWTK